MIKLEFKTFVSIKHVSKSKIKSFPNKVLLTYLQFPENFSHLRYLMLFPALHYFPNSSSTPAVHPPSHLSFLKILLVTFLPTDVCFHPLARLLYFIFETIYFNSKYIRYCSSYRLSQVLQRNGNFIFASKLGYYKLLLYQQTQLM